MHLSFWEIKIYMKNLGGFTVWGKTFSESAKLKFFSFLFIPEG